MPTNEDILFTRAKSTGVQETKFDLNVNGRARCIHLIDVAGQRSERRKWMHHFASVDLVIYFSSLESYCQVMYEDEITNRFKDDLDLFTQLMKMDDLLQKRYWFCFLNKSDLFKKRLAEFPMSKYFDDVPAEKGSDFDYCIKYIEDKFKQRWSGDQLIFATTCVLETSHMTTIFNEIQELITANEGSFVKKL